MNLTGVNYLRRQPPDVMAVVPDAPGGAWPATSNLNLARRADRANLVSSRSAPTASIRLFNESGSVDLVVDVVGYLVNGAAESTAAGRVVPLASPFRVLDTRSRPSARPARAREGRGLELPDVRRRREDRRRSGRRAVGAVRQPHRRRARKQYVGPAGRQHDGLPVAARAAAAPPNVSNLNLGQGEAVPNMALLRYGGDRPTIRFFNFAGYVDYIFDVYAVVLAD